MCLNEYSVSATCDIGSHDTILVRDLADLVVRYCVQRSKIVRLLANDDSRHFVPDLSKAKTDLGFEAVHNVRGTLRELVHTTE
jgi:nucleoside-diphosphate-sugar epimerase